MGELVNALRHSAVLAWSDAELVGVATYVIGADACELLTLHAETRRSGVGTALVGAESGLVPSTPAANCCGW